MKTDIHENTFLIQRAAFTAKELVLNFYVKYGLFQTKFHRPECEAEDVIRELSDDLLVNGDTSTELIKELDAIAEKAYPVDWELYAQATCKRGGMFQFLKWRNTFIGITQ